MSSRLRGEIFDDFSGGLVTNRAVTALDKTEALDLDNCIVLPSGKGIKKCRGNTAHNATAFNSGANMQGLVYYKQADGDDYLVCVGGNKLGTDAGLTGTFSDVTGALTITSGANNKWDLVVFNDNVYGFGGPSTGPNAPFKYTGSGNGAALGGTPPSAHGAFQHNNRLFAYRTAANPSRIAWSILDNGENWTGTGSGNADVWTSDGDTLVGHAILDQDHILLFKQTSIHLLLGRTNPFPIFPLFQHDDRATGVGAVGKHSIITVDGATYFVTPRGRAYVTNGQDLKPLDPKGDIDDVWDGLSVSRLPFIEGFYYSGKEFRWLVWMASYGSASTNDYAIIWDLDNKCWLRNTKGWGGNVAAITQSGLLYTGHYDGKVYKQDVASTFTYASESSANVRWKWRSGWMGNKDLLTGTQFRKAIASLKAQTSGGITLRAGYDFSADSINTVLDQTALGGKLNQFVLDQSVLGGQTDVIRDAETPGRGNVFQIAVENVDNEDAQVNNFSLLFKPTEQKSFAAT